MQIMRAGNKPQRRHCCTTETPANNPSNSRRQTCCRSQLQHLYDSISEVTTGTTIDSEQTDCQLELRTGDPSREA